MRLIKYLNTDFFLHFLLMVVSGQALTPDRKLRPRRHEFLAVLLHKIRWLIAISLFTLNIYGRQVLEPILRLHKTFYVWCQGTGSNIMSDKQEQCLVYV